jgi:hypothetical protein
VVVKNSTKGRKNYTSEAFSHFSYDPCDPYDIQHSLISEQYNFKDALFVGFWYLGGLVQTVESFVVAYAGY